MQLLAVAQAIEGIDERSITDKCSMSDVKIWAGLGRDFLCARFFSRFLHKIEKRLSMFESVCF